MRSKAQVCILQFQAPRTGWLPALVYLVGMTQVYHLCHDIPGDGHGHHLKRQNLVTLAAYAFLLHLFLAVHQLEPQSLSFLQL